MIFGVIAVLSGCASTSPSMYSGADTPDAATITGTSVRYGFFDWENYVVVGVDNQRVSQAMQDWFGSIADPETKIAPGEHVVLVRAHFNKEYPSKGPFRGFIPVRLKFVAGGKYRVNGAVRANSVEAWIEEVPAGKVVSEVVAASYTPEQRSPSVYVPIIVPK